MQILWRGRSDARSRPHSHLLGERQYAANRHGFGNTNSHAPFRWLGANGRDAHLARIFGRGLGGNATADGLWRANGHKLAARRLSEGHHHAHAPRVLAQEWHSV